MSDMPPSIPASPEGDWTSFGGVEQTRPTQADIQFVDRMSGGKSITPSKYNLYETRKPSEVVAQYTPREQIDLPESNTILKAKGLTPISDLPPSIPASPEAALPPSIPASSMAAETPPPSIPASSVSKDDQQPWFSGDPTADVLNSIHNFAKGIVDSPAKTAASIVDKTVTGGASFMGTAGAELLPILFLGSDQQMIDDMKNNPGMAFANLRERANKTGESVGEYVRKTLHDTVAIASGASNAQANQAYIPSKDMAPNAAGDAGTQIIAAAATRGIAPIAQYLEEQTTKYLGKNAGAIVGMIGDAAMLGQGIKAKAPEKKGMPVTPLTQDQIETLRQAKDDARSEYNQEANPTQQLELPGLPKDDSSAQDRGMFKGAIDKEALTTDENGMPYDAAKSAELASEEAQGAPRTGEHEAKGGAPVEEPKEPAPVSEPVKDTLPEPMGTKPVKEGYVRLYHELEDDPTKLKSIEENGLVAGEKDSAGNPASVYASKERFYGTGSKAVIEIQVPKDRVGANNTVKGNVPKEDILNIHRPGDDLARKIISDPELQRRAHAGEFDHLDGPGDARAIKYVKDNYGPKTEEPATPNTRKINKGTFGQSGAVSPSIFSHNDTPKRAANWEAAKALVGRMDMTVQEFMAKFKPALQDIKHRAGFATGSFRTLNELISNVKNKLHAIHTGAFLDDTMHLMAEKLERTIVETILPHTRAFVSYYKTETKTGFLTMYKTLKTDVPIVLWFERHSDEWFNGTDYAPTKAQLMERGMSEGSAEAWGHIYSAYDAMWPHLVDFAKLKGIPVPPRVPGYLPHFHQGAWSVRLFSQDASGRPKQYHATVGAVSSRDAARLLKHVEALIDKDDPAQANWKAEIQSPKPGADMATMISGIFDVQEKMNRKGAMNKLLETLYEQASIGSLNSALERQRKPQILHQIERISMPGSDFQLRPMQARAALGKMIQLMEAIPMMNMRAHFIRDVLLPLEHNGYFRNLPNLTKAMQEYTKQFLHINDVSSAHLDKMVSTIFAEPFGFDPNLPLIAITRTYAGAAKYYLLANPKYYAQQMLQNIVTAGALFTAKANLQSQGIHGISISKALLDHFTSFSRTTKLESGESLKSYMEKTGHATPTQMENLGQTGKYSPARAVERYTRQQGALLGYSVFKQLEGREGLNWTQKDTLNAAGKLTDIMNVPYDKELGKPFAFSKEGVVGKPFTLFSEYWMHFYQLLNNQTRTVVSSAKSGSVPAMTTALGGLAYTALSGIFLGGLAGGVGAGFWDLISKVINKVFGTQLPSTIQTARNIGDWARKDWGDEYGNLVGKFLEFGAPSMFAGYDISSSLRGPMPSIPEAYQNVLETAAIYLAFAGRTGLGQPPSRQEMGEYVYKLPTLLRGTAEYLLHHGTYKGILDAMVEGEDAPDHADITQKGEYHRSGQDQIMNMLGFKSVEESSISHDASLTAQKKAILEMQRERTIKILRENQDDPVVANKAINNLLDLYMKFGIGSPTDIDSTIEKYDTEKDMTPTERRELHTTDGSAIQEENLYQAEKKQNPYYKGPR